MHKPINNKLTYPDIIYDTPVKNQNQKKHLEHLTADQTYQKSNQKSIQSSHSIQLSNTNMNIFKKKKYFKMIKKINLHLLSQEALKLHELKFSADTCSDAVKDLYKNQLDKIYVVIGRIAKIHQEKKYYVIYCQDDALKEYKFYFTKQFNRQKQQKNIHKNQYQSKRRIKNLDQLEFQFIYGEGTPYFKFFIIFRQIPIYENGNEQILNSEETQSEKDEEQQNSYRKKFIPKIKGTEFRIYIQHFEKLTNFNQISWHNMHICFERINEERIKAKRLEYFSDI